MKQERPIVGGEVETFCRTVETPAGHSRRARYRCDVVLNQHSRAHESIQTCVRRRRTIKLVYGVKLIRSGQIGVLLKCTDEGN